MRHYPKDICFLGSSFYLLITHFLFKEFLILMFRNSFFLEGYNEKQRKELTVTTKNFVLMPKLL